MEKDRRLPCKLHIARTALSFFMALALCVHAPLQARAASAANQGLSIEVNPVVAQAMLHGSVINDSLGMASLSYEGQASMRINIGRTSGTSWNYATGVVSFPVTFSFGGTAPLPGDISVSIDNVSAPEGVSVAMHGSAQAVGSSVTPTLRMSFNELPVYFYSQVSVTFTVRGTFYLGLANRPTLPVSRAFSATIGNRSTSYYAYEHFTDRGQKNIWILQTANLINSNLKDITSNVTTQSTAIQKKIQAQTDNDNSNTAKLQGTLNANSKTEIADADRNSAAEIAAANANSKAEIADADRNAASITSTLNANHKAQTENDDKNADDIMHGYDTTDQDSGNKKFDDSQKELEQVEGSLFGDALTGFSSLDMSQYSFGRFTSMLGALTFVSGFLQSAFVKMGDFGAIVTVGLVVMIATKVIGIYRFSTGGDG